MLKDRLIDQLNSQLSQLLGGSAANEEDRNELQKSVHAVIQSVFSKLDLVTREEFDAQRAVLAKTRSRIEELEQQLEELSSKLED
jgi:BMFP domain-containing protein YqiC